jgi:hypothetical protein
MLIAPLTLIIAIAPPVPEAGAHIVSPDLIIINEMNRKFKPKIT